MNIKIVKSILAMYPHCSETYAIARSRTGTHTQVSLQVIFIACTKSYFHFLFYDIYPANRTFPNVVETLHGKTFYLNCQAENLKQPSTLGLRSESKYFAISVANQLNQKSFMNRLLTESSDCSYTHIQLQWTISFRKEMFCYGVANHLY